MGKLRVYNHITLDGYFEGPNHDISWHTVGSEENEYATQMLGCGDTLLFGRVTYDLMAGFWPARAGIKHDPVTEGMNSAEKIVFSRTMTHAEWHNTRVLTGDIIREIQALKNVPRKNMTIMGSGSIVTQCAQAGLIDEYEFMVNPVVLGQGTSLFHGIAHRMELRCMGSRVFPSGNVLLCYQAR